jgi:GxxExxY protein
VSGGGVGPTQFGVRTETADQVSLTEHIIGAGIEVHRNHGPGLLESVYEDCLCSELVDRGINFRRQACIPIVYKGRTLRSVYRPDLIVENDVIVEIKAIDRLADVHLAQMLTYLKVTNIKVGLLLNFNEAVLRKGIKRVSL